MRRIFFTSVRLALAFGWLAAAPLHAANVTSPYTDSLVASGIPNGTAMDFSPDGRLFVLQQTGAVRVIKNGALLATPFAMFSVDSADERGLLGIAFDPGFDANHFVYFYHTVPGTASHNRITRLTASGDVALGGSAVAILDLENLSAATNHNGGAIHFGADGKLYVAVGDNANGANAQNLASRFGKMLRINADGTTPSDNPFGGGSAVWALGLRNPFTFAVRVDTGALFINDVGQDTWEEINVGVAGANYGWPTTEGPTGNPSFRSPLYAYRHSGGTPTGCAIAGGAFWFGRYYFADLCSGWIYSIDPASPATATQLASGISQPVDLKSGPDGGLYYLERGANSVRVIRGPDVPIPFGAITALATLLAAVGALATRTRRARVA